MFQIISLKNTLNKLNFYSASLLLSSLRKKKMKENQQIKEDMKKYMDQEMKKNCLNLFRL